MHMHFVHAYCVCIRACCTAYSMLVLFTVRVGMLCVHMSCWHFVHAVSMLCLHDDILCLHDGMLCMNIGMLCMNTDIVHEH